MYRVAVPSLQILLGDIGNINLVERELRTDLISLWYFNLNCIWEGVDPNRSFKDFLEDLEQPWSDNIKNIDWDPVLREIAHRYYCNYDNYQYILKTAFYRINEHCCQLARVCTFIGTTDPALMVVEQMTTYDTILLFFRNYEEYSEYHGRCS